VDPAELSQGEFAYGLRRAVEQTDARVVVIDSLNGYLNALPDKDLLAVQMHELLTYLDQRGVLTLLVLAQHGLVGDELEAPTDISYLADATLLLRYFEVGGEVRRAISAIKKRTGTHERTIRELHLGAGRIEIGPPACPRPTTLGYTPSRRSPLTCPTATWAPPRFTVTRSMWT
jgi:circadian clock protein KaiC